MPRILTAAVTNKGVAYLEPHIKTVQWQTVKSDMYYLYDGEEPGQYLLGVEGMKSFPTTPHTPADSYTVTPITHEWNVPTFHWLAKERQRLIDYARDHRYDYIWIVDSDLLFDRRTLASLLSCAKPVVSAVFWTQWTPDQGPMPQVWLRHPYGLANGRYSEQDFLSALDQRQLLQVAGLGACTLIRADVFDRVKYWPLVEGLPNEGLWQGEDRHFCVGAQRAHVPLHADAWPDIFHIYREADLANVDEALTILGKTHDGRPSLDSVVSITVEPLEEPRFPNHVEPLRGVLKHLHLLPEIVQAILSLTPGEESFVTVSFHPWYDLLEYRGQRKLFRVRLVDVK